MNDKTRALLFISNEIYNSQDLKIDHELIISNTYHAAEMHFGYQYAVMIKKACIQYLELNQTPSTDGFYNYLSKIKASELF